MNYSEIMVEMQHGVCGRCYAHQPAVWWRRLPLIRCPRCKGVWRKAAADRRAVAELLGVDCEIDAILDAIRRMQQDLAPRYAEADRLDADAADRALAEKIVREHWRGGGRIDLALAGIRAGRDAERGALPPKDKDKGDE